jgi:branched-chain amino acid transport system substrate-binding protein
MSSIGVMLGGSTMYPSIGIDFLQGIRSCLSFHLQTDINLSVFPIGYGTKEDEIYKQAEKFLLSENVDAVVLYADDRHATILSPLFKAAGKLLIISNAGANYPTASEQHDHILFHSLNDNLHSFLTGRLCAMRSQQKTAMVATSYYDGGYQHCHAMSESFMSKGGEITYNFVSHFKKEAFTIYPLAGFVQNNPDVKDLLCLYCGDMARFFYKDMIELQQQFDLRLYGSPLMFDSTPGDFAEAKPSIPPITGYTGWVSSLNNPHNLAFMEHFQNETGKEANLFALQGWEVGLLTTEFFLHRADKKNTQAAIAAMKQQTRSSPRGTLRIHSSNEVLAPAWLVNASGQMNVTVTDCIENPSDIWDEMIAQVPTTQFSSWQNTYLCI